jgi:hypothetical protein
VRKPWTYYALDDPSEMLFLHEFDDESHADQPIAQPDSAAEWMRRDAHGPYPPVFVGRLLDDMAIESSG